MFKGGRPVGGVDRGKADRMVKDIEGMLVSRLNDVLNHPEFRRLEAAWRGLKFLVDRTDFRDAIELDVVSAPKGELVRIMEAELTDRTPAPPGWTRCWRPSSSATLPKIWTSQDARRSAPRRSGPRS